MAKLSRKATKKIGNGKREVARILRNLMREQAVGQAVQAVLEGRATIARTTSDGAGKVSNKSVAGFPAIKSKRLTLRRQQDLALLKRGISRSADGLFVDLAPFDELFVEEAPFSEIFADLAPFEEAFVEQAPFDELFAEKVESGFGPNKRISKSWKIPLKGQSGLQNVSLVKLFDRIKNAK